MKVVISTDEEQPNAAYRGALLCAGALPEEVVVATPSGERPPDLDGLLLAGGADVHPALYGETPDSPTLELREERDALDLDLLSLSERLGAPVFGICRGLQLLNVALGGTLWQDLPSQRDRGIAHAFHRDRGFAPTHPAHLVTTRPASPVSSFGKLFAASRELAVNSRHHQAVKDLAPSLVPLAASPDDLVEALEREGRFFGAVQWHPEDLVADPFQKALFRAFLAACRAFARERGRAGPPPIEVRLHGAIPVVKLNRPARGNAFAVEMATMLAQTVEALGSDPTVPALVVTGNGASFCDGYETETLDAFLHAGDAAGFAEALEVQGRLASTLLSAPRPVIAALDGPAAGPGLALALACDVRIASPRAVALSPRPESGLADGPLVDGGLVALLAEAAGNGAAADALFSGEAIPLSRARELRLVDAVVDDGEALPHALARAALYAETPVATLAATKRTLNADRLRRLSEALQREAAGLTELFRTRAGRRPVSLLPLEKAQEVS